MAPASVSYLGMREPTFGHAGFHVSPRHSIKDATPRMRTRDDELLMSSQSAAVKRILEALRRPCMPFTRVLRAGGPKLRPKLGSSMAPGPMR